MSLQGKRVAVLVEQQYQEMEVWYPVYRLREEGCAAELVGPEVGKTYSSKLGYPAKATLTASDARADQFAAVVIPGGFSPDYIRRSRAMLSLVEGIYAQGKPVAAICHGPWVLCSARLPQGESVLKGKKVTCFHSIRDDVQNAGGTYVDQEVAIDGNVVTSRTPEDLPAFVVALMEMMRKG